MQALVIVTYGPHLNPDSNAPAYNRANTARETSTFDEARTGFWKGESSIREMLRTVGTNKMYVTPLSISEGYFMGQVIPWELRLDGWDMADWDSGGLSTSHVTLIANDMPEKTIHYCGPAGTYAAMTEVLIRRAETITGDPNIGEGFGLAVVGHGTECSENSTKAIEYRADRICEMDHPDEVQVLYMGEGPEVDDMTDYFDSENVVTVPPFVADGFYTQEDAPRGMGLTDNCRTGYDVLAKIEGHRIWYAGVVGTERFMADAVSRRAVDASADTGNSLEVVHERTWKTLQRTN